MSKNIMIHLERQIAALPEPYIVMGVGVPGSGKSTSLEVIAHNLAIARICPDDIREAMTGSAADQSVNAEVWSEAYKQAAIYLRLGRSAIIDATHAEAWRRAQQVAQYRQYGAAAVAAIVFDTSLEVSKMRNTTRPRVVPESVIDRMYSALQKKPVSYDEGFDEIYIVKGGYDT